jgi:DNA-directed RNA polymerase III subunit RPC3
MNAAKSAKAALAVSILEEHFGKKVSLVAAYLLTHERNTLTEIAQYFAKATAEEKMKLSVIKETLLVLLQHQCLLMTRPYAAPSHDESVELYSGLEYGLNVDAVLYRLRFPHLVEVCGKYFGDIAVNIMEELVQHGRVPIRMAVEGVMGRLEASGADDFTSQDDVMSVFQKLIQQRFIVPVQALDIAVVRAEPPVVGTDILGGIEKAPAAGTGGRKRRAGDSVSASASSTVNTEAAAKKPRNTIRAPAAAAATPSASDELLPLEIRLMLQKQQQATGEPSSTSSSSSGVVTTSSVSKRGGRGGGRGRGRGRREEDSVDQLAAAGAGLARESPSGTSSTLGPRESVLWTIGWEQLDREERHQLCINVAHQRMGTLAGAIVKIILDRSMPTEMGAKQSHSSPMTLLDLCAVLRESKAKTSGAAGAGSGGGVDIQTIRQVMDLMRCDALGMVDKLSLSHTQAGGSGPAESTNGTTSNGKDSGGAQAQYTINISGICRAVGARLMRNIAEEKFGKASARIVELLQKHKFLEQQKLSEMLILPAREGRERLYELFKHHWVEVLEVSKRGDYSAASTSFFWNLDRAKVQPQLLEGMYGTLLNLRTRKRLELERGREVLAFHRTITDKEEKARYQRLCLSLNRLDNSIVKVIENILVLGAW